VGKVTIQAEDNTSEGLALRAGEPMISPDIEKETRFRYPPFLTENGVRAVANVIIIGGKGRQPCIIAGPRSSWRPANAAWRATRHEPDQRRRCCVRKRVRLT
jgi:hypothetical protein